MGYVSSFRDAVRIDELKIDLLRTAYDNDRAFLNQFDPRMLLVWYAIFIFLPWLFFDLTPLLILFLVSAILAARSQVSLFLVATLAFSTASNLFFYGLLATYLGDAGPSVVAALVPFTLKLTIVSILSLAVFSSMSPRNLSKALLSFRVPHQFTFVIAYGYRMLPVLVEEYHALVNTYRLRSKAPENAGILRWRHYLYLVTVIVKAFYPMIFNVAKRARVTVEAMETKGFSHALGEDQSRDLRLAELRSTPKDAAFFCASIAFAAALVVVF
ncbi:energy-coupling factor transporter transmembrane component T family protein [Halegenticoccus tardaugens]|uniref:energy-coupling factor transporter transmembrane component T family protein n=1 Tax=Halegenticoccus tardaugens TaxID=2071624 RepID=UPI00100A7FA5|nr:energy-coupling factor transporter transmembrane component T [Halegenticoccus tardaugens]